MSKLEVAKIKLDLEVRHSYLMGYYGAISESISENFMDFLHMKWLIFMALELLQDR